MHNERADGGGHRENPTSRGGLSGVQQFFGEGDSRDVPLSVQGAAVLASGCDPRAVLPAKPQAATRPNPHAM